MEHEQSDAERKAAAAAVVARQKEREAAMNAERLKDIEEVKLLQPTYAVAAAVFCDNIVFVSWYQEELARLERAGESWATVKV